MSDAAFEAARRLFAEGLAALRSGDAATAEARFVASLERVPGRASTLANLAAARLALGRADEALAPLDEALAAEPGDADLWAQRGRALLATSWPDFARQSLERALALRPDHALAHALHGQALQQLERPADALAACERALALATAPSHPPSSPPDVAELHSQRGTLLARLGRRDDAAAAFAAAIDAGADAELHGWYLDALAGRARERAAPAAYVRALFDDYAERFETHLVATLGYRGDALIAACLERVAPGRRFASALDLGCGSGLCGRALRERCDRLEGVDVSARMLAQAREAGGYDALAHAEALAHLRAQPPAAHDLIVAGDVFVYFGRLDDVLDAAHRALRPGGWLAFTLEALEDAAADVEAGDALRGTRSRHGAGHVRALATRGGWRIGALEAATLRTENERPVAGWIVALQR